MSIIYTLLFISNTRAKEEKNTPLRAITRENTNFKNGTNPQTVLKGIKFLKNIGSKMYQKFQVKPNKLLNFYLHGNFV